PAGSRPGGVPGRPPGGKRGGGLMFEQLEAVRARYKAITERLADPAVHANLKELQRLSKEQAQLKDLVQLYEAYRRAEHAMAEARRWKVDMLSENVTERGGFKEVVFEVRGHGAYSRLKFENGVHRVQRVPETEAQGRIHTSTATVVVMPEAEEVDVAIDPERL